MVIMRMVMMIIIIMTMMTTIRMMLMLLMVVLSTHATPHLQAITTTRRQVRSASWRAWPGMSSRPSKMMSRMVTVGWDE